MFDGHRMMTARQLYFTLATAFASQTYGHQISWQLEAKGRRSAATSGMPQQSSALTYQAQSENQSFAAGCPTTATNGGLSDPELLSTTHATATAKHQGHTLEPAIEEPQLPVNGPMRFSGAMRSTGYADSQA